MTKQEIDEKYLIQASQLEAEFFDIVDEGLPNQHRELRAGKLLDDFNLAHGQIWKEHEAELISNGFMKAPIPPEPERDLVTEIDELKARVEQLEKK